MLCDWREVIIRFLVTDSVIPGSYLINAGRYTHILWNGYITYR